MKWLACFIFFGLLISCAYGRAQDTTIFALEDAVGYGLENHSGIQAQETKLEYREKLTEAERSRYLPNIRATADYRYNTNLPVSILPGDAFGQQGNGPLEIQMGTRNSLQTGLRLEQPVYDPVIFSDVDEREIREKMADNQLGKERKKVALQIRRMYFRAVLYHELVKSSQKNLKRYDTLARVVKDKYRNGLISESRLLETLNKQENQQLELEMNRMKFQNAINRLKLAMDYPQDIKMQLKDTALANLVDEEILPSGAEFAYKNVPGFKSVELRQELNHEQVTRLGRRYQPVLSAIGFIGADYYDDVFSPIENDNRWYRHSFIGLSLRVPVFEGFSANRRRQALDIQAEMIATQKAQLASDLKSREKILADEIRINMKRAQKRKNEYQLSARKLQDATNNLKSGLAGYRDVLIADMEMQMKYQAWISSLLDVLNSSLEYEEVTAVY